MKDTIPTELMPDGEAQKPKRWHDFSDKLGGVSQKLVVRGVVQLHVRKYREKDREFWLFAVTPDSKGSLKEPYIYVRGFTTKEEAKKKAMLAAIRWLEDQIVVIKDLCAELEDG